MGSAIAKPGGPVMGEVGESLESAVGVAFAEAVKTEAPAGCAAKNWSPRRAVINAAKIAAASLRNACCI
jgi:hypothetical protein